MPVAVRAYLGAFVAFCIMDAVWLGVVATDFYFDRLGGLLREDPNWVAAGIFYLGYIAGVVYFAILPTTPDAGWLAAAKRGALLGLLAYATYDMTNMATLVGWSPVVSAVDMVWGMVITGTSAVAGYMASAGARAGNPT
ncbi:MAG: DUF2177 family protein [Alphaproteobacteria bacterium]|jgi:uncharacterized membrane protein|nr:DUF2177 family protein [Alphaproteobacteria bacterium]